MKTKALSGITIDSFLSMFEMFTYKEQIKIASIIQKKTLAERWNELKKYLPDIDINEESVIKEVKSVRNNR
ncbi:MAG: hypothetical protein HY738_07280 [Bacteroidia bacterium]|nr:hypothetical protein [Bacteroidia bacterium]